MKRYLLLILLYCSALFAQAFAQGDLGDLSSAVTPAIAGTSYTSIRCSTQQAFSSTSSVGVTFPTCATAGDLLLIFIAGQNNVTTFPSGWTNQGGDFGGSYSYWGGGVATKILTSADVTAGSATFTVGSTGTTVTASVEFTGTTAGFSAGDVAYSQNGFSTSASVSGPATPLPIQPDDLVLMFGSHRGNGTDSISTGTLLQTAAASTDGTGVLYSSYSSGASAAFTPTFSYGTYNPNGNFQMVVIVHGGVSFTPKSIPGLQLWYSASCMTVTNGICNSLPSDSSSVTVWVNQASYVNATGSGTCTFHTSQINSQPSLTFDGSSCYFSIASPPVAFTERTMAAVFANSSSSAKAELFGSALSGPAYWTCNSSKEQGMDAQQVAQVGTGTAACDTSWHQVNALQSGSSAPTFRIGRATDALLSSNGRALSNPGPATVGRSGSGSSEFFNGKGAEFVYYSHSLSSAEITLLETYLNTKYGL